MTISILIGDCRDVLKTLPDASVQCCVTSPPYYGLRDYGVSGQIGLERSMHDFIGELVAVFREVRRVLRDDGTLWLNLGDSYAGSWGNQGRKEERGTQRPINGGMLTPVHDGRYPTTGSNTGKIRTEGVKPKDLYGIPWMVAFALRADGWYLRQDIIWHKPNPMPESVTDRCTKAHEYVFLLSKSARYWYDAKAIAEAGVGRETYFGSDSYSTGSGRNDSGSYSPEPCETRNKRSVWTVPTQPFRDAHFATFPPALIEPCILAGSRPGDTILDPFGGAGTTGLVADRLQRDAILVELNPQYAEMARRRIHGDAPLFAEVDGG